MTIDGCACNFFVIFYWMQYHSNSPWHENCKHQSNVWIFSLFSVIKDQEYEEKIVWLPAAFKGLSRPWSNIFSSPLLCSSAADSKAAEKDRKAFRLRWKISEALTFAIYCSLQGKKKLDIPTFHYIMLSFQTKQRWKTSFNLGISN